MKCPPFPCNSNYYYEALCNAAPSDDEQFEELISKRSRKKNLHYKLEKTINQIIHDAKKNCHVNSDFEQVEKLPNQNGEFVYSDDSLDDIDIILKKKKTKNMFSKLNKKEPPGHISLPPKSTKQRIYSLRECNQEVKNLSGTISGENDSPKVDLPNEEIIENFKNVLCNGLNKYIKDMLEEAKEGTPTQETYEASDCADLNSSYYKTSDNKRDVFNEERANRCEAPPEYNPNIEGEYSQKCSSFDLLNWKNENTRESKTHDDEQPFEVNTHGNDKPPRNPTPGTRNKNEYTTPTADAKKKPKLWKKNYRHKRTNFNRSKYMRNVYPSKRKKWTNENALSLDEKKTARWKDTTEMYDKRSNVPRGYLERHSIKSAGGISNTNGNPYTAKLPAPKQHQRYNPSRMNCTSGSSEDFAFSHFQKNANNDNLVGKFRF
ncbi:unnamed protein product [Plasmodium vivax]|uniref:(malaria parasite P. vivax) hypothetical protein n=1 Tax=Plasmodium vivax TaxID=5855 RepID=A0A564ZWL2_PLAVI|nr:unnamed protein product [Plasmodium vivax]CAI7721164.1 conserved Plasmodium protein, unknown function [Plasmodium vivax]VUZ96769.1 conserved Plasmodium protein, unknown function [Plasmodium vivax]